MPLVERVHAREVRVVRHRGQPRLEEVGAERDDEPRRTEIERRPRHAVALLVRLHHRVVGEQVEGHVRRHAEGGEPAVEERREAPALVAVDEERVAGLAARHELSEPLLEELQRFLPRRAHERAVAAHHRTGEPVGVVQALERRLAACAERAAVQGMRRIALELDRPSIAHLGDDAAGRSAFAARRRVVLRHARHDAVGLHEIWNEPLDIAGAAPGDGARRARDAEDLQEIAPAHSGRRVVVTHSQT